MREFVLQLKGVFLQVLSQESLIEAIGKIRGRAANVLRARRRGKRRGANAGKRRWRELRHGQQHRREARATDVIHARFRKIPYARNSPILVAKGIENAELV